MAGDPDERHHNAHRTCRSHSIPGCPLRKAQPHPRRAPGSTGAKVTPQGSNEPQEVWDTWRDSWRGFCNSDGGGDGGGRGSRGHLRDNQVRPVHGRVGAETEDLSFVWTLCHGSRWQVRRCQLGEVRPEVCSSYRSAAGSGTLQPERAAIGDANVAMLKNCCVGVTRTRVECAVIPPVSVPQASWWHFTAEADASCTRPPPLSPGIHSGEGTSTVSLVLLMILCP